MTPVPLRHHKPCKQIEKGESVVVAMLSVVERNGSDAVKFITVLENIGGLPYHMRS